MTFAKRHFLIIVFFLCLASAWGGRALLCSLALRHLVLPAVQAEFPGLQFQFQGLDTNLYSRLQIRQIVVDYCRTGDCFHLRIPSLTLALAPSGFMPWQGTDSLLRHLALDLEGAAVSVDILSDNSPASQTTPLLPVLPTLPAITARDCSLAFQGYGATISAQGVTLVTPNFASASAEAYELKVTARALSISGGAWPPQQGSLAATLSYQNGRLQVPSLFFQEVLLLDEGILATDPQGLQFSMRLHLLQSQGLVQGRLNQEELALSFHLAEGDLSELARMAGDEQKISGQLLADGEMTMNLDKPTALSGSVTAKIIDGSWNGIPLDNFELSARAADQSLTIDNMKLQIGQNQLTIEQGVLPIPELQKQAWLPLLASSRAQAELRLTAPELLPEVWTALFLADWQALGLASASASLRLQDGRLRAPQAEISGQAGRVGIKDFAVDLTGNLSDWLELPWSLSWQAELSDAAVVHYFYEDWPATGGKAQGQGTFSGTLAEPHLPFAATFMGASLYGVTLAKVSGQLEWTKNRLALEVTASNRDRDQLTYQGIIDVDQGALLPTQVVANLADMHPYLPKMLIGDSVLSGPVIGKLTIAGLYPNLTGKLTASGDWTVEGAKLSTAALEAGFSGKKWQVEQLVGSLADTVTINTAGRFEPSADWLRAAIDLDRLVLSYREQQVNLTAPGSLTVSSKAVTIRSPLSFDGKAGRFRLEGNRPGEAARLSLVGEDLRDTGLLRQLSGKDIGFSGLGLTVDMTGGLTNPAWRWQGKVKGLAVAGSPLTLDGVFDLAYDDHGLQVTECAFENADQSIKLAGHLPLTVKNRQWDYLPYPMEFSAKIDLPEGGIIPRLFPEWLAESGDLHADLSFTGAWEQPLGQIQFSVNGVTPGPRLAILPPGPFAAQGVLQLKKDQLSIAKLDVRSPALNLQLAGAIKQMPLAALVDSDLKAIPGQLEVSGRYALPTIDWLATKLTGLRRTAGSAAGTFALTGPLSNPELRAGLSLKNGEARGSDSLLVFRDIALDVSLEHQQLTINTFSGTMGGSPVQGTGTIKTVFAETPELDLRVTGKDLLLYRADGMKIRADTALTLAGTTKAPLLSGEIMLTDSRITKRVDWLSFLKPGTSHNGDAVFRLFSCKDEPLRDTRLAIRIKTTQAMVIANNVFKGGVRPDLLLSGTGEVPYLTGVIYSDSGRITLPSGRLDLQNGLIRFADDAPDRPQLEFQASGQMMAYDITAQVRGTYDEPEVTLSSVPPLANEDLLLLLLTGRRPVKEGQTNSGVSTVAVYLGRGLLSRLFGETVDQSLLLDRLEVDVGRAVTQQGAPTVDARVKLADGLWKADTSYYLTGEKDIWDYYNGGLRAVFRFR